MNVGSTTMVPATIAGKYKSDIVLYEAIEIYPREHSTRGLQKFSFVVNIPFICQNCGTCCKDGFPSTHTQDMIDHLGISKDEIIDMFHREPPEDFTGRWLPCPFLKNNLCSIYPVRPECCKRYNGQTQLDWNCPARRRQDEISDCMKKWHPDSVTTWGLEFWIDNESPLSDLATSILDPYTLPSKKEWNNIWGRFQAMDPTEEETGIFLALNRVSTHFEEGSVDYGR